MASRVKTDNGYYHTSRSGRYGYLDGIEEKAAIFCEEHAKEIAQIIGDVGVNAAVEEVESDKECIACKPYTSR